MTLWEVRRFEAFTVFVSAEGEVPYATVPVAGTVPVFHLKVALATPKVACVVTEIPLMVSELEVTVTVAVQVMLPPAPVAVRVYVVVEEGETVVEPDAATEPIP